MRRLGMRLRAGGKEAALALLVVDTLGTLVGNVQRRLSSGSWGEGGPLGGGCLPHAATETVGSVFLLSVGAGHLAPPEAIGQGAPVLLGPSIGPCVRQDGLGYAAATDRPPQEGGLPETVPEGTSLPVMPQSRTPPNTRFLSDWGRGGRFWMVSHGALRCVCPKVILLLLAKEIHVAIPSLTGGQGQSPRPWKEEECGCRGATCWLGDTFPQGTGLH